MKFSNIANIFFVCLMTAASFLVYVTLSSADALEKNSATLERNTARLERESEAIKVLQAETVDEANQIEYILSTLDRIGVSIVTNPDGSLTITVPNIDPSLPPTVVTIPAMQTNVIAPTTTTTPTRKRSYSPTTTTTTTTRPGNSQGHGKP